MLPVFEAINSSPVEADSSAIEMAPESLEKIPSAAPLICPLDFKYSSAIAIMIYESIPSLGDFPIVAQAFSGSSTTPL